jgi:hypothetical protein
MVEHSKSGFDEETNLNVSKHSHLVLCGKPNPAQLSTALPKQNFHPVSCKVKSNLFFSWLFSAQTSMDDGFWSKTGGYAVQNNYEVVGFALI